MSGRFAPSPTGRLHLGNLRTAAIAWMSARSGGRGFLVRMEDLDPHQSSRDNEDGQLAELASIGMDWDGEVVRQSERFHLYEDAIATLRNQGLVYECFCTRREIQAEIEAAAHAPHLPPGAYRGTCRDLTPAERAARREAGRPPALRLRTNAEVIAFFDRVHGVVEAPIDDMVLRRNDGIPAYNLAVVVDDALQGVTEVVRGDDLLLSTPRHLHLQSLLGLSRPEYAHVPLVMGDNGQRLSKRSGDVTVEGLAEAGVGAERIVSWIGSTLGQDEPGEAVTLAELATGFDWSDIPRHPVPTPELHPIR